MSAQRFFVALFVLGGMCSLVGRYQYNAGWDAGTEATKKAAKAADIELGAFAQTDIAKANKALAQQEDRERFLAPEIQTPLGGWTYTDHTAGSDWQVMSLWQATGMADAASTTPADVRSSWTKGKGDKGNDTLRVTCRGREWNVAQSDPEYTAQCQLILAELVVIHATEHLQSLHRIIGEHELRG